MNRFAPSRGLAFLPLTLIWVCSANAQTLTNSIPATPEAPSFVAAFFRLLGSLIFVIALFLGGAWLARNWHRVARRTGRPWRLEVIEARAIGNRQTLLVVGYDSLRLLVGSSPAGVTFLTQLPPATPEEIAARNTPSVEASPGFAAALKNVLERKS